MSMGVVSNNTLFTKSGGGLDLAGRLYTVWQPHPCIRPYKGIQSQVWWLHNVDTLPTSLWQGVMKGPQVEGYGKVHKLYFLEHFAKSWPLQA